MTSLGVGRTLPLGLESLPQGDDMAEVRTVSVLRTPFVAGVEPRASTVDVPDDG
jgi:hypothetical protein